MKRRINKKLYVTVIGALFTAPLMAQADGGNTTLYGQARLSIANIDNEATSVTQITNDDSRFGVKGFENLGNGLKAIFQLEVQAEFDDGDGGTAGGFLSSGRSSYVGLVSGLGTAALGIIDSPHRESTDKIDGFGNTLADHNTIIGNAGNGNTTAEFNRRNGNSINYWSPRFEGLQFKGQYSFDEIDGVDRNFYGAAVFYENGPLYAGLGYEVHEDDLATVTDINDTEGFKAGIAYAFNEEKTRVGFIYDKISEDNVRSNFDRDAWYLNLSHKSGNNTFKVGFAVAEGSDTVDSAATPTVDESDDGAMFYFVGLSHNITKRTEIYGLYAQTENDTRGRFGLGNSTNGNTATTVFGADIYGFAVGMVHKF